MSRIGSGQDLREGACNHEASTTKTSTHSLSPHTWHHLSRLSSRLPPPSSLWKGSHWSLPQLMPRRCFHVDLIYRTEPDTVPISSFDNIPSVFFKKRLILVYVQASCPIIEAKGSIFLCTLRKRLRGWRVVSLIFEIY